MAKQRDGRTIYAFTAPQERAEAIAAAADEYPDEKLGAKVTPIRNADEAHDAYHRAFDMVTTTGGQYLERNMEAVLERYMKLGETGTDSLVELDVPARGPSFDFQTFYGRVEELL
jgi:hypothetical protein